MYSLIIQPFLLGLSVGLYCLAHCLPFVSSYLVSEKRSVKKNFNLIFQLIIGRFFGYLLFGAFFGYLGEKINNQILDSILIISLILLSVLLILHALNLFKFKWACHFQVLKKRKSTPLFMGFLLGFHLCPPFLLSVAYVIKLGSLWQGIVYFIMFFIGTSLYYLPITFLGPLAKMKEFRLAARIASLIVGSGFIIYGLYYLIR